MTQCVNRSSSYSNPAGASSWRKGCRPQLQLALQLRNMHWISYFNGFELHQARDENKHWQVLYTQVHLTAISPPFEKKKKVPLSPVTKNLKAFLPQEWTSVLDHRKLVEFLGLIVQISRLFITSKRIIPCTERLADDISILFWRLRTWNVDFTLSNCIHS